MDPSLYIVATPIGHLGDMSQRAIDCLKTVDFIFVEDTRHAKKLLDAYQIDRPYHSLHEHNEQQRLSIALSYMAEGHKIALISDAGTPLVSDPGYRLVCAAIEHGYRVSPIPGACAAIAALSVAGLPTDRFVFEGFLPAKQIARCTRLEQLKTESRTLVVYESCHRLLATLQDLCTLFGAERKIVVAREMTKCFEEIQSGSCQQLLDAFTLKNQVQKKVIKGEIVIVVAGCPATKLATAETLSDKEIVLMQQLQQKLPPKEIANIVQATFQGSKKHYYDWLLAHKVDSFD